MHSHQQKPCVWASSQGSDHSIVFPFSSSSMFIGNAIYFFLFSTKPLKFTLQVPICNEQERRLRPLPAALRQLCAPPHRQHRQAKGGAPRRRQPCRGRIVPSLRHSCACSRNRPPVGKENKLQRPLIQQKNPPLAFCPIFRAARVPGHIEKNIMTLGE